MRKRRYSKIQWGQTGRQRQASTRSGATPFREGGRPRELAFGHQFHAAMERTVLDLERAERLARAFLLRRAKHGEAFAVRLLRERYHLRVATGAEVQQENQRRGLPALGVAGGIAAGGPPAPPRPVGHGPAPRGAAGVVWAGPRGMRAASSAALASR